MTCEHELNCIDEEWISDNQVIVTMECSLCNSTFRGELKQDE